MLQLTADWDIGAASLLHGRLLEVVILFEADLIVEYIDILQLEPLPNFFFRGAALPCAHHKFNGELLGLYRVIVAPYLQVFWLNAFELLLPYFNLI